MRDQLIATLEKLNREIAAGEEILNDGIDYDSTFRTELDNHVNDMVRAAKELKTILGNHYGIFGI